MQSCRCPALISRNGCQPLARQVRSGHGDAGDVSAGAGQAGDQDRRDRVGSDHHDGNGLVVSRASCTVGVVQANIISARLFNERSENFPRPRLVPPLVK